MIYAQEIVELYPWLADIVGTGVFTITASQAHYGYYGPTAQNDSLTWEANLKAGTYTLTDLCLNGSALGIASISNGGSTLGTIDKYNGSTTYNNADTATGLALVAGDIAQTASTKNASSSAYANPSTYSRLVRTGD